MQAPQDLPQDGLQQSAAGSLHVGDPLELEPQQDSPMSQPATSQRPQWHDEEEDFEDYEEAVPGQPSARRDESEDEDEAAELDHRARVPAGTSVSAGPPTHEEDPDQSFEDEFEEDDESLNLRTSQELSQRVERRQEQPARTPISKKTSEIDEYDDFERESSNGWEGSSGSIGLKNAISAPAKARPDKTLVATGHNQSVSSMSEEEHFSSYISNQPGEGRGVNDSVASYDEEGDWFEDDSGESLQPPGDFGS